jgi:hypothetical protein
VSARQAHPWLPHRLAPGRLLAKRCGNQCQTSRSRLTRRAAARCAPTLNSLPPALQPGLDIALAVADPAFGAKAHEPGFAVALAVTGRSVRPIVRRDR